MFVSINLQNCRSIMPFIYFFLFRAICERGNFRLPFGILLQEGGKGGETELKSHHKEPQKDMCGQENFPVFEKNCVFKAIFMDFYLDPGKKLSGARKGGSIKCPAGEGIRTLPFRRG